MAYNSTIPSYKTGNCSCGCNGINVQGRKVGKIFYCTSSYNRMKTKEAIRKQKEKNAVRSLIHTDSNKKIANKVISNVGISNLIADLDFYVSKYIRLKYANKDGIVSCFTCDKNYGWLQVDCGHFIKRENLATRFLESNLRPQCITCNRFENGNIKVYAERLEAESEGITDWLAEQASQVYKPTQTELKELLADFKAKLKLVEGKFKK